MQLWIGLAFLGAALFYASYHYSARFLDWLRFQSIGTRDYIVERLSMMFIDVNPNTVLGVLFASSFGLGTLVFLLFLPQLFPAIVFGGVVTAVGWKAPKPVVNWLYNRRVNKFNLQMVDGLALMANGMKSGLSVVQAMGLVTQEMENPIKQEFELVLNENRLGVALEEAFTNLSKRIENDDVEMFVTAVNILKETGGNLAETFDTIVITIRERIKVQQKIRTLTTQGFFQGMAVLAVPPLLGVVFATSDPELMKPLVSHFLGWILIFVIVGLEVLGFFLIMKLIKVDV